MLELLRKLFVAASFMRTRTFAIAILFLVAAAVVAGATSQPQIVSVYDGRNVTTCYTTETDPRDILEESGIATFAFDAVDFTGFENKLGEISITRAFPVTVRCDGVMTVLMMTGGNVSDALEQADVTLGESDLVSLDLNRPVAEDDIITVTRQKFVTRRESLELPFEEKIIATSLLAPGKQKLLVEGREGERLDTYACVYIDGEVEEEYLQSEDTIREPVTQEVLVGFASQAVSPLDFSVEFDENGEPLEYAEVLRSRRAAGYSAQPGASTAGGYPAAVGYIAVNPEVIPYGSKLFIQSPDQKFVYGYAVAADTGYALLDGTIDVDLFYGSYEESTLNGIRDVDIFILE